MTFLHFDGLSLHWEKILVDATPMLVAQMTAWLIVSGIGVDSSTKLDVKKFNFWKSLVQCICGRIMFVYMKATWIIIFGECHQHKIHVIFIVPYICRTKAVIINSVRDYTAMNITNRSMTSSSINMTLHRPKPVKCFTDNITPTFTRY